MERIPRAAITVALTMTLGFCAMTQERAVAAESTAATPAALSPTHLPTKSRMGTPRLIVLPSSAVPGRLVVRARVHRLRGVRWVRLLVDGLRVATLRPRGGIFTGANGWIDARGRRETRILVRLDIRRRGGTLRLRRAVTVPLREVDVRHRPRPVAPPSGPARRLLWGAWIDGERWGFGDAPWDSRTIDRFEAEAGKRPSIIHWGQFWYAGGIPQPFYPGDFNAVRSRGAIPLIDWNSWDRANGGSPDQPAFQLQDIISGNHDPYIRSWATSARDWGKPFFLRFDHEMNGTWFPWSEARNGNQPGQFVQAWRHVHDIFESVGATNVTWVWSPNVIYPGSLPLDGLYPGDAHVDWVAMDGYNWGSNPVKPAGWRTFSQTFTPTYDALGTLAPAKPAMIAEIASTESGGSKAAWIADALSTQLPSAFPRVKALVWFDWNADGMDWVIETSPAAQASFASAISSATYVTNEFSTLSASPVPAP